MKKLLPILLAIIVSCPSLFAKTITVSNNPNSPGQFRRLDSAILAASAGDVLLVSGSTTDYNVAGANGGSLTIDKQLTIYGQGYDPRKDQALPTTISVIHMTAAGSGTIISGIAIGAFFSDANTNNITITRCRISEFGYQFGGNGGNGINGNNYVLRENIITGVINIPANHGDIIIQNNIIGNGISSGTTNTNITVTNNYFTNILLPALANATVSNNIFYIKTAAATASAYVSGSVTNCVFNNNIYFNTSNANPLAIGVSNNSGSGNINANPAFVNLDLTSMTVTRADNFNLQAGSPGLGAGTDGKDIGPEGGSIPMQYPYAGQPAIPQVQTMSITNPVVAPNGTLNVTFKAKANN